MTESPPVATGVVGVVGVAGILLVTTGDAGSDDELVVARALVTAGTCSILRCLALSFFFSFLACSCASNCCSASFRSCS